MSIKNEKFVLVLGKEKKFVPATPEDLKSETSVIITSSQEEFNQKVEQHKQDGWSLVEEEKDYAKFKNEFPVLMETTAYMRQQKLPDFVEIKLEQ